MDCPLRSLDMIQKQKLEADITIEEIEKVLRQMQKGKAPGPNGLLMEF